MESVEVFISYHQKDQELGEELENHLASLQREKTITSWSDRQIKAGQELKGEINKSLNQAGLILLLVSPDFIASDYHWTVEVTRALEQNAAGKARACFETITTTEWRRSLGIAVKECSKFFISGSNAAKLRSAVDSTFHNVALTINFTTK